MQIVRLARGKVYGSRCAFCMIDTVAVHRSITRRLQETVAARRVTVVTGPRQAGKTTLAGLLLRVLESGELRSLDEPGLLEAARADPVGFVTPGVRPLILDEVQRLGEPLVRAVKVQVDRDPAPGQFVLTGSSNFLTVPTISESLAGRAGFVEVWPFTQGEIAGRAESFVDAVFSEPQTLVDRKPTQLDKLDLLQRVVAGGYPEVQRLQSRQRSGWFRDYVRTTVERDIVELAGIRKINELHQLLRLLAARTANELIMQDVIRDSALERQAVYDHRAWLETIHLVMTIPAWSRNLTQRVKRRPKVYITDPGLAAWLLGKSAEALAEPLEPATGALVETFVAMELRRQLTWAEIEVSMYHFQDRSGAEVDLILETADGRVVAIEVKAGETPKREWFHWLAHIRDRLGDPFVLGLVLYTGGQVLPFGDRLVAAPIPTLWEV